MLQIILGLASILFFFVLNILGMMNMFPLYITSPLLFISILFTLSRLNHRKTFKGF
ncbi:hypothetical protein OIO07_19805 [Bacillus paralicheniformis]|uniref:Membrane protein YizD n=1 Tax=Bacillus paralicheniformis TaxID=1648923 RepID=A0ABY3FUZ5_9BACI|nr:hypothetical protein [Bacillus paralicheniformis]KUL09647.1 membrane protein [Bacillus licheniformis LMG 7559]AGN35751.1 YizD [Bacillus paralicheniformis ATCC 9945a]KND06316.1 membrane protein [Bacillus paralicheniformis]MCM3423243.1 hypothetical protein [Bacillus paralicheniformis]MCR3890786.1 hypothetical protein [Bacillus paralicheniformis]